MTVAPIESRAPAANVRHDLDAQKVSLAIQRSIDSHEKYRAQRLAEIMVTRAEYAEAVVKDNAKGWAGPPSTDEFINRMFDERKQLELDHYAKVRVIELPQKGNRFVLVYGDVEDAQVTHGTGPFETQQGAEAWFFSGGR